MDCVDAGNILVHLYLQTKTRYALTNKKLQCLLIIAQMARLSQGSTLFADDIRNFRQSFVLDTIGNNFISDSEIVSGITNDMPIRYDISRFVLPYSKKKIYEIAQMPSDEDKSLLVSVFLRFGAYRENTLCKLLCDFKALRNTPAFSVIPKEKISTFFSVAVSGNQYVRNPIFNFVIEQCSDVEGAADAAENNDLRPEPVDTPATAPMSEPAPIEQPVPVLEKAPVAPICQPKAILKGLSSLQNIVVGKQYSVLVELSSPTYDCQITVLALSSNKHIDVARKRISDTLYRFTFVGIASDIKISANVVG